MKLSSNQFGLLYAASDSAIEKLIAPLTPESEQTANNSLPSFANMMKEIKKGTWSIPTFKWV